MAKRKILIVDDDVDLMRGLTIRLHANGYEVVHATDAIFAVSVALEEKPDLIILDIGLPGGDGYMVMDRLNKIASTIGTPIIVLSARDVASNKERAIKAGAQAFFQKPADNDELLATIRKAVGEGAVSSATNDI
jgi:two-component system KDP operon response regulator KdpE